MAAAKTTKKAETLVALESARVAHKDGSVLVIRGQAYPADHPAVKAAPHLFGPGADEYQPYTRRAVERATAAPGEQR